MSDENKCQGANVNLEHEEVKIKRKNDLLLGFKLIIWGFVLTGITLQIAGLQFVLPAIGVMCFFLGFRVLKGVNAHFQRGYITSILIAAVLFVRYVYHATIFSRITDDLPVVIMNLAKFILYLFLCSQLSRGMKETVKRNKESQIALSGAGGLMAFYAVHLAAAFFFENVDGDTALLQLVVGSALVIWFIVLLKKLWKSAKALKKAGVRVKHIPDIAGIWIVSGYLGALLCCVLLCLRFCSAFPMSWEKESVDLLPEHEMIRENLLSLGLPEDILDDLSEEDLLLLKDAKRVKTDIENCEVKNTNNETEAKLKGTTLAIEVPATRLSDNVGWIVMYHFVWEDGPAYHYTDSIEMCPLWNRSAYDSDFSKGKELIVSGRLLYEEGTTSYTAPYFSLGESAYSDELYVMRSLYGLFSFPKDGDNCRGYMLYYMESTENGLSCNMDLLAQYVHTNKWYIYPMAIASDVKIFNDANNEHFLKALFQLMFQPSKE